MPQYVLKKLQKFKLNQNIEVFLQGQIHWLENLDNAMTSLKINLYETFPYHYLEFHFGMCIEISKKCNENIVEYIIKVSFKT